MSAADTENSETGRLAENIVYFARALRRAGLPVGPASVLDAIRAVEVAGVATRADFYWALHSIFVTKREHRPVFDEAFRLFWRSRRNLEQLLANFLETDYEPEEVEKERPAAARVAEAMFPDLETRSRLSKKEEEIESRLLVSDEELLQHRDFAQMSAAELAEAKRRIEAMRLPEDRVRARRLVAAPTAGMIDARRTLRASLRTGGKMILLRHRRQAEINPPIVILADISGSMGEYTRIFLHFMHALGERRRVHSFLFGTRLTNVIRQLRLKDPDEALVACSKLVPDWSGGTRIATALHTFNRLWGRRVLGQGAIVLLFTDGLERDTDEDLGREMDRLHRSCRRLIWLNPLLRYSGFEPKSKGIQAILPHVDDFRPVHNLNSLQDLADSLARPGPRMEDKNTPWNSQAA
jgi:uncharacterized protein with von Willebrand factor type A (vWA) domain